MPSPPDLILRSRRVVLPDGVRAASVHVAGGVITAIGEHGDAVDAARVVDAGDALLLPGLVDTHVHVNEPGRTHWEGFASATRAAAAGGVTTLIEMPLNSIPATTTADAFRAKLDAAAGRVRVDTGFWGGVVPGNTGELRPLWEAGAWGFKCFLVPSGVDEFENVGEADLRAAMPVLAELGAPLLVHAELPGPIARAAAECTTLDPRRYASYLLSRPPEAEAEAIALLIRLCREFGTRVHVVHLAAAEALPMLREARAEGLPITVETCPHYLHFAAEDIADGATAWKCAPPIRGSAQREALWDALGAEEIDLVASDHSPCPPEMKRPELGDFFGAWGGIASLQLGLPVMWTEARARGFGPEHLARWMSAAPARLAGLGHRKGAIAVGRDADLVIFDPDVEVCIDPAELQHRHHVTPYAGGAFCGEVLATYLRGEPVYERGRFGADPAGHILLRGQE